MKKFPWSMGLCALLLAGCGGDGGGVDRGSLGGACHADGACDEGLACDAEYDVCLPQDACADEDCSGHGACAVTADGQIFCVCDDGFRVDGMDCVEIDPCDGVDCSGHGTCAVTGGDQVVCICDDGYEEEGLACVLPDPCTGVDCSGHGFCAVADGDTPVCVCDNGYYADGLACLELDVCRGVTCSEHGTCVPVDGEPTCSCDEHYAAEGLACVFTGCEDVRCSYHGTCRASDDGAPECDCDEGYTDMGLRCFNHVIEGTFVITDNPDEVTGNTATDLFDPLEQAEIEFQVGFDVASQSYWEDYGADEYHTVLDSEPLVIEFSGDDSGTTDMLEGLLDGLTNSFEFVDMGPQYFYFGNLVGARSATVRIGMEISPVSVDLPMDGDYIVPGPFSAENAAFKLRRYDDDAPGSTTMTDVATGTCSLSFR